VVSYISFLKSDLVMSKNTSVLVFCKVKQSHYKPGQALWVPGGRGSQISRESTCKSDKVVSRTHWPPLPARNTPGIHFC
jgi:hypothetical protein